MDKKDKIFRRSFIIISIMVMLSFSVIFIWQFDPTDILNTFLVAASTAGFFGLLGQMILTLVQEYYKRKTYHVVFVYRQSNFSEALASGIQNYIAQVPDMKLTTHAIPKGETAEEAMLEFLRKDASKYDGVILRPIHTNAEMFVAVHRLLTSKKEVVLVDLDFPEELKVDFPQDNPPFFLGSDFEHGGNLVATFLHDFATKNGFANTRLILLIGPDHISSAKQRGQQIVWNVCQNGLHTISSFIPIKSFDETQAIERFNQKIASLIASDEWNHKHIAIFCANDSIALELMKQQVSDPTSMISQLAEKAKEIHYIGYDGVMDDERTYKLQRFSLNFSTIDVLPMVQGERAAEAMQEALYDKQSVLNLTELVKPNLYTHVEEDI